MKMYKWFVWSPSLKSYLALPGLIPFHRGECDKALYPGYLEDVGCSLSFSIPMFNTHSPAKRVF